MSHPQQTPMKYGGISWGLEVNWTVVRPSELAARLTELAAKQHTAVVVRADARAPFKQVAAVMDACKTAGVQQVSLATTE